MVRGIHLVSAPGFDPWTGQPYGAVIEYRQPSQLPVHQCGRPSRPRSQPRSVIVAPLRLPVGFAVGAAGTAIVIVMLATSARTGRHKLLPSRERAARRPGWIKNGPRLLNRSRAVVVSVIAAAIRYRLEGEVLLAGRVVADAVALVPERSPGPVDHGPPAALLAVGAGLEGLGDDDVVDGGAGAAAVVLAKVSVVEVPVAMNV